MTFATNILYYSDIFKDFYEGRSRTMFDINKIPS